MWARPFLFGGGQVQSPPFLHTQRRGRRAEPGSALLLGRRALDERGIARRGLALGWIVVASGRRRCEPSATLAAAMADRRRHDRGAGGCERRHLLRRRLCD